MSGSGKETKGGASPNCSGKGNDPNSPHLSDSFHEDSFQADAPAATSRLAFEKFQRSIEPMSFPMDFPLSNNHSDHIYSDEAVPYSRFQSSPELNPGPELRPDEHHAPYGSYEEFQDATSRLRKVDSFAAKTLADFRTRYIANIADCDPGAYSTVANAGDHPFATRSAGSVAIEGHHPNNMQISPNLNNPGVIPPETLEIISQMRNTRRIKCAQFGNIPLRRFHTHEGARQVKSMLTDQRGVVDPFVFIRLQNVNPVAVMGDDYIHFAHSVGLAIYKGFFGCIRTRMLEGFRYFCQVLNSRYTGPRACKAMIMPEDNMVAKLGREITDALMFEAEQLDVEISFRNSSQQPMAPPRPPPPPVQQPIIHYRKGDPPPPPPPPGPSVYREHLYQHNKRWRQAQMSDPNHRPGNFGGYDVSASAVPKSTAAMFHKGSYDVHRGPPGFEREAPGGKGAGRGLQPKIKTAPTTISAPLQHGRTTTTAHFVDAFEAFECRASDRDVLDRAASVRNQNS